MGVSRVRFWASARPYSFSGVVSVMLSPNRIDSVDYAGQDRNHLFDEPDHRPECFCVVVREPPVEPEDVAALIRGVGEPDRLEEADEEREVINEDGFKDVPSQADNQVDALEEAPEQCYELDRSFVAEVP